MSSRIHCVCIAICSASWQEIQELTRILTVHTLSVTTVRWITYCPLEQDVILKATWLKYTVIWVFLTHCNNTASVYVDVKVRCCPRHSPLTIAAQDSSLAKPWQPRAGASVPGHIRFRPCQQHPVPVICEPKPHQYCCQCQWLRQPPLVLCQRGTSSHDLPIQLC